nr:MAG TPA: hypothetical protein [Caudoviricetes sp.]
MLQYSIAKINQDYRNILLMEVNLLLLYKDLLPSRTLQKT